MFVDFWAEWCGPCHQFGPVFEAAAEQHTDIVFGKVDADAEPGALPAHALDDLIGQIKEIDMDDVRRQIADEQAAHEQAAESD